MSQIDTVVTALPHEYCQPIGEFLFRFAQLEYQLQEVIWAALDLGPKEGRILTIGADGKALRQMAKTITGVDLWVKTKQHKQEINMVAEALRKHSEMRNAIAHGSWQSPDGRSSGARLHFMKRSENRIVPKYKPSLDDRLIQKWASQLKSANERARKLISNLNAVRPSRLTMAP